MGPSQHQTATGRDVPTSQSSSSLSSSFSSSAASSMLMHAAPPSDSSQSDIASPDISASSPTSSKKRFFSTPNIFTPQPRSASLAAMGQAFSKGPQTPPSDSNSRSESPGTPTSAGQKLKRAFAGRRKKTEEASPASSSQKLSAKGKERAAELRSPAISASSSDESRLSYRGQPLRLPSGAKQMTLQLATSTLQVFSHRRGLLSSKSSPLPPPPPPKPPGMTASRSTPMSSPPPVPPIDIAPPPPSSPPPSTYPPTKQDNRASVIPTSPSIAPALDFLRASDNEAAEAPRPRERRDPEKESEKEIWRRSDSTMASHSTIRPGAGSRSPRPLSIAESLQSTSTVMGVNKRLSSIITDADYATPEEDVSDDSEPHAPAAPRAITPPSSNKTRNRRSVSLNLGSPFQLKSKSPAGGELSRTPEFEIDAPAFSSRSFTEPKSMSHARDTPTLSKTSATGFIAPMHDYDAPAPPDPSFKGRLAAWNAPQSPSFGHGLNPSPEPSAERRTASDVHGSSQSIRQTAISMTGGLAPAAFGFGKRAVEKMGRAWGGLTSSASSGHSSSSSSIAPSSFSGGSPLGRVHSNQSVSSQSNASGSFAGKFKQRRTPNAPSATWSISSSATSSSVSGEEGFSATPSGPALGKRMRGPLRTISGSGAASGLVFGRDLKSCVRETAVNPGRWDLSDNDLGSPGHRRQRSRGLDMEIVGAKALEDRMLPALVVRCAQHLLRWGIEEEGLFRISGRSSHINKLRAEFDTGADYDISECSPGDLDPHAVASIFKAYLRELPEPILTHALIPYFDAAMTAENNARSAEDSERRVQRASRGPGLPTNPKSGAPGLRKPPSLSTLAMPNFSGMRPPSQPLLKAISSLISRLPVENRALLRTVTELIKETAKRHKDTKMPLSNLLLVFCPSLSMGPPLLRVLCEAEGIWDGPLKGAEDPYVVDVKADPSPVIDIRRVEEEDDVVHSDEEDLNESRVADIPETSAGPEVVRGAQDEDEEIKWDGEERAVMDFPPVAERRIMRPATASAVRSPSPLHESSLAPSQTDSVYAPRMAPSDSASLRDDAASYVSASDVPSSGASGHLYNPNSPPALTSSTDSLATPSTMSEDPSLPSALSVDRDIAQGKAFSPYSQPSSPKIADNSDLPLTPSHERTGSASPVPFPSELEKAAHTYLDRSRSGVVSLSNVAREREDHTRSASTSTVPLPRAPRMKKPSLHLLFTKRKSGSPVASPSWQSDTHGTSPYLHTAATSQSSISMPGTAVTAPQTSTMSLPPKLDLSIESSPIKFDIAGSADVNAEKTQAPGLVSPESSESASTVTHAPPAMQERSLSSVSSSTYESSRSHETPIADMYCQGSNQSTLSVRAPSVADSPVAAPELARFPASPPDAKNQYSIYVDDDDSEEDWVGSVLKAAEAENGATEPS
ncbi:RhoGAP-domain-containing protein [Heliocybe sulcata]|uniref:RhoGAP-domain-containing protein n=1 Tax=Heliocybe sulcata TaxID=5364 RepID=A0A5C3NE98_9AGAM|nr:RhoGAP-domain-containing protein [Heliocybe sulcata]